MPWHVAQSSKCPAGKPWAVIKDADGHIEGCHPTKGAAQKQMAALYASEGKTMADQELTERAAPDGELRFAVAPITNVDVRDTTGTYDDTWTMSGYAAVFNETTTLYDSKFLRLTESVHPGFFDRVLREQQLGQPDGVVHFNFGHDMNRAVAATDVPAGQPGSLELYADQRGLFFLAKVPRDDPDGVAMAAKMRSGVLRQASFAFTIAKAEDSVVEGDDDGPDTEHRVLLEAKRLYDVCATAQGVYSQTVSGLRSYAAALGQPTTGGQHRQPDLGGGIVVNSETGGDEDEEARPAWLDEVEAVLLRARAAPFFSGIGRIRER
jgi:HK97 family phage prohead protease